MISISTPAGRGGVAVIRLSGDSPLAVASKMFLPSGKTAVADFQPYRMYPGGPEIPIDMPEDVFNKNAEAAAKMGIPYSTRMKKDGTVTAVFALPNGKYTESASEAIDFMSKYRR